MGEVIGRLNNWVTELKLTVSADGEPRTRAKPCNCILLFLAIQVTGAILRIGKGITHALNCGNADGWRGINPAESRLTSSFLELCYVWPPVLIPSHSQKSPRARGTLSPVIMAFFLSCNVQFPAFA
jgi:hypothetical protein